MHVYLSNIKGSQQLAQAVAIALPVLELTLFEFGKVEKLNFLTDTSHLTTKA